MKTKPKQSKFLIALATILCCIISVNSFGQNTIPSLQDFHGTWVGQNVDGRNVSVTLTSDWRCNFTVSGQSLSVNNPVIAYRLPDYLGASQPTSPQITIKFFTQGAISGIRVAASSNNASSSINDHSLSVNTVEQIYTGLAVISSTTTGQLQMAIYMDPQNFTSVPPALDPDPSQNRPYCTLVKQ